MANSAAARGRDDRGNARPAQAGHPAPVDIELLQNDNRECILKEGEPRRVVQQLPYG